MAGEISKLFVAIGIDDRELTKGLKGIEKKMTNVGANMAKLGAGITAAVGLVGGASLKMAADFDSAMREVNTMMLLNKDEFQAFSKEIREMSVALGVSAVESAKALYQAISAGVPRENVIEFLQVATKAAIGGVTDTTTAVDGLTTVLNAFKLPITDAQKVADMMFTTIKGGKTTFEELSASLFNVAPIAAASGVSFEEVAAALAAMTQQGVPTSQATTQLRQAFVALQKPTADMQEVITDLGYESGQAMLQEKGFAETLNLLRESTGGSNEMLMRMFGSVEAGQAVLSLTGQNAQDLAAAIDDMANSAGAATKAYEEVEEGPARQMEALKALFEDVFISIGTALMPALLQLVAAVKPIIEQVGQWVSENTELTKNILIAAGAIGVLLATLGPLLMMLPAIAAGFALMLGPLGIVIAAMVALGAIAHAVITNWEPITLFFRSMILTMSDDIKAFHQFVVDAFQRIGEAIWQPIKAAIETAIAWIDAIIQAITGLVDWVSGWFRETAAGGGGPAIHAPGTVTAETPGLYEPQHFQGGGIVRGLRGQPVPAIVHGGEYIFEPGELRNFTAELKGIFESLAGGRETPVNMYLDGEKVGEVVLRRGGEKYMQLSHIGGRA